MSCASIKKLAQNSAPSVKAGTVAIKALSFKTVDLLLDLEIQNPNPISIPLSGIEYDVHIGENKLFSGKNNQTKRLSAKEKTLIQVPISVELSSILKTAKSLLSLNEIALDISTKLSFDIPLIGKKSVAARFNPSIPIPQIPKIKVKGLRKNSLSFSGAELTLDLEVQNPNKTFIKLDQLQYGLKLNNKSILNSSLGDVKEVKAGKKALIPIKFKVNLLSAGSIIYDMLSSSSSINASFDGSYNFNLGYDFFKPLKQSFSTKQKIKLK